MSARKSVTFVDAKKDREEEDQDFFRRSANMLSVLSRSVKRDAEKDIQYICEKTFNSYLLGDLSKSVTQQILVLAEREVLDDKGIVIKKKTPLGKNYVIK